MGQGILVEAPGGVVILKGRMRPCPSCLPVHLLESKVKGGLPWGCVHELRRRAVAGASRLQAKELVGERGKMCQCR